MMPAAMIAADRGAGLRDVVECGERDLRELRLRQQLHRDLGDDRQQALAAGDERQQIVAGRVERVAAELDDLAGDEHRAHAAHVVHGEPVLEAVHAARVLGDVAADRAGDLRRRIGRVEQSVAARPPRRSRDCARPAARPRCARADRSERIRLNLASDSTTPLRCRQRATGQARCLRRARRPARARRGNAAGSRRPAPRCRAARRRRAARDTA